MKPAHSFIRNCFCRNTAGPARKAGFTLRGRPLPALVMPAALLVPLVFLLGSCIGVSLDIALNQDGTGTAALEYRISKSLDSLGKLDGNGRWNTIPVGKADFERTLDRLPGIKLKSFSSKEDAEDLVITAVMEFSSMEGLLAFLDASGRTVSYSGGAGPDARGQGRLTVTLNGGSRGIDPGFAELLADISGSYTVKMSMSFPGGGTLALSDSQGRPLDAIPGSGIQGAGKKVSCSIPLYSVLTLAEGLRLEFNW